MGLAALLERALSGIATNVRRSSPAEVFRRADRLRRDGRHAEAAALVAEGLSRSPRSAAGHLLAAYLHYSSREMAPAKEAFHRVLSIDPDHPRALLGLARLALEEGQPDTAGSFLRRALQYHPDFPEAAALEEMIANWTAPSPSAAPPAAAESPQGLRLEPDSREAILARPDGTVAFADCDEARQPALARHTLDIARMAASTLARAGLGTLRRGAVETDRETMHLLTDAGLVLSVTTPVTTPLGDGLGQLRRIWDAHVATGEARG